MNVQRLQDLDEQRAQRIKGFIMEGANIEKSVLPIINRCIEGMVNAANSIDHTEASVTVSPVLNSLTPDSCSSYVFHSGANCCMKG